MSAATYESSAPPSRVYGVLVIENPLTRQLTFGNGGNFYVLDASGMWSCQTPTGWHVQILGYRSSYAAPAGADFDAAIRDLPQRLDWSALYKRTPETFLEITLIPAAPAGFFGDARGLSGAPVPVVEEGPIFNGVGAVEGGTIRLDYYSPELKMPASFWIDFAARKVVRGVVGGHEMKLGLNGAPGTAVDGTNLVTPAMRAWAEAFRTGKKEEPAAPPAPQTTPSP